MPRYECNIAVEVDADNPLDAARQASSQFRDPDVAYWMIGVNDLDAAGGPDAEEVFDERELIED